MSAGGEFQRLVRDCLEVLERGGDASATQAWREGLAVASREARHDLSAGARTALEGIAGGGEPELGSALHAEEFARRREHLVELCRVILGLGAVC